MAEPQLKQHGGSEEHVSKRSRHLAASVHGFDGERLKRLDRWVQEQVDEHRVAGMAVALLRRGEEKKLVHSTRAGFQDEAGGIPLAEDTIFRIYSMTKPIASVALMMLYEEGLFHLDDPISKYAPEFTKMRVAVGGTFPNIDTVEATTPITFQHVLTHTTGFTYGFIPDEFGVNKFYEAHGVHFNALEAQGKHVVEPLAEICKKLAAAPLLFQPGSQWNYGVSADVAGYLVEVLSHTPLDVFLRERILKPLGMVDTDFWVPPEKRHRFATCYIAAPPPAPTTDPTTATTTTTADKPRLYKQMDTGAPYFALPAGASGGGGLVSTIHDYTRFCHMLLNGGELDGTRLLGPHTLDLMMRNHLNGDLAAIGKPTYLNMHRPGVGFGLGFAICLNPARIPLLCAEGEASWGGMASTCFFVDRTNGIAAILMTQLVPSSTYTFRKSLRSLVYQALLE